jgi:pilus assembly protein CpaF
MSFELILPFLRPIEPLLLDESMSEIMGDPDASWWYERDGIIHRERTISFAAGKIRTGLEVVANQLGKRLHEDNPLLNAQLPDGSRFAAAIAPVVRPSPSLTIRKFTSRHCTVDDLIARGTRTRPLAESLSEQIRSGKTLLISGGTGNGKTMLLRILADFISEQDSHPCCHRGHLRASIQKPNILAVECQTDTFKANISFDDLLKSALRRIPDRIIMGEVRASRPGRCSIPSTQAMRVRWPPFMRTQPRRPSGALPIWSCETTRKPPSPTPKQRSERQLIWSSMSSVSWDAACSARFVVMTATRNCS